MSKSQYFDATVFSKYYLKGANQVVNYLRTIRIPRTDVLGNRLQNDCKYKELEMHCSYQHLLKFLVQPNFNGIYYCKFIALLNIAELVDLFIYRQIRSSVVVDILRSPECVTQYNFFVHLNHHVMQELYGCESSMTELQKYIWDILKPEQKRWICANLRFARCVKKKMSNDMDIYSNVVNEMFRNSYKLICGCKSVQNCECDFR